MGTNYYARINICPTCGHPEEEYHLGKSSWGWKFTFHYDYCLEEGYNMSNEINIDGYSFSDCEFC